MRLSQLIDRLPIGTVEYMNNIELWQSGKARWPAATADSAALNHAIQQLSPYGDRLLRYWIRAVGPMPIEEERLKERVVREAGIAAAEARAGLRELRACGILFAVRKSWGEELLFLPDDCYAAWRRALCKGDPWEELSAEPETAFGEPVRAPANENGIATHARSREHYEVPLGRRLLRAYSALDRTGLGLTSKRLFPKKTAAVVADMLNVPLIGVMPRLRVLHGDSYPFSFALALDIAAELDLLALTEDGGYRWREDVLAEWLNGYSLQREAELIRLFTMRYGYRSPAEAWFATGLLLLEPGRVYESALPLRSWQLEWIDTLLACGWAKAERTAAGGMTFSWLCNPDPASFSGDGEGIEPLIALPDGELIVPPNAKLSLRWLLEQSASWIREDTVSIYRLTDTAVSAAAERGLQAAALLQALEEAACGIPLPDELVHAVRHWVSRTGRTSIEDAVLLRCESKEMADAVCASNGLTSMLAERVGDCVFLISPANINRVQRELERAGWPPILRTNASGGNTASSARVANGSKPSAEAIRWKGNSATAAFIYNERSLHRYELLQPQAGAHNESGSVWHEPAPAEWPTAWTEQLRSYHHSTRRQLLQKALAWGAPVQLNMDGHLVELVPERVDEGEQNWAVSGILRDPMNCEQVRLSPDKWQEMKIIVPIAKT